MSETLPAPTKTPGFFHLRQPDDVTLRAAMAAAAEAPLSYDEVGATAKVPPKGWKVDRAGGPLGMGEATWRRARQAVREGRMFDMDWIQLAPLGELEEGLPVVFASWQGGFWALNACRIVYVIDEVVDGVHRFGFAYGTTAAHAIRGEERLMVEWDEETDAVRFDIYKFSKPRHPLVVLTLPIARMIQDQFNRGALRAMQQAVTE